MRKTLSTLRKMVQDGEKIATLTCYDASFARLLEEAGVDILLVGDSLGMVLQGHETTLPVTMGDMEYHVKCVARGSSKAFIVADMPFGSYQENPQQAFDNAARLMRAGAQMVKIEGGRPMVETVRFLTERGVPVFAHLGLTPQSVHQLGGFKVQGKDEAHATQMLEDAKALRDAGAALLLLEAVPASLAKQITEETGLPTIGIGAGVDCSGQVLVVYDMLGVYHYMPKFARNFMEGNRSIQAAVAVYVKAVKDKTFPSSQHSF